MLEKKPGKKVDQRRAEAAIDRALKTRDGIHRVAAAMSNPVKRMLDYKAIFRNLVVVETNYPEAHPLSYDRDLEPIPAIRIGSTATSRFVDCNPERIFLDEFEIVSRVKVPYRELYTRKYKVLNRAKERLVEGVGIREDILGFSLIEDASIFGGHYGNTPISETTSLSKASLSRAFAQLKNRRVPPGTMLMNPIGTSGIQRWGWNEIDQEGFKEIRQSGYLGNLWRSSFYESDLVKVNKAYVLGDPDIVGWMPIRKDIEVTGGDEPDYIRLGFIAYMLLGMAITNISGIASVEFDATK